MSFPAARMCVCVLLYALCVCVLLYALCECVLLYALCEDVCYPCWLTYIPLICIPADIFALFIFR